VIWGRKYGDGKSSGNTHPGFRPSGIRPCDLGTEDNDISMEVLYLLSEINGCSEALKQTTLHL